MKTLILGLALLAAAAPAAAVVYTATYTGTLESGYDFSGAFGQSDRDLAGLSYIATYTYDTAAGTRITSERDESIESLDGLNDELAGGYDLDDIENIRVRSSITINGRTVKLVGNYYSVYAKENYVEHVAEQLGAPRNTPYVYNSSIVSWARLGDSGYLIEALPQQIALDGGTSFEFNRLNLDTGKRQAFLGNDSDGDITVSVTESVAAVPEPTTWAMLIAGFGLVGAAARRRTAVRVTA